MPSKWGSFSQGRTGSTVTYPGYSDGGQTTGTDSSERLLGREYGVQRIQYGNLASYHNFPNDPAATCALSKGPQGVDYGVGHRAVYFSIQAYNPNNTIQTGWLQIADPCNNYIKDSAGNIQQIPKDPDGNNYPDTGKDELISHYIERIGREIRYWLSLHPATRIYFTFSHEPKDDANHLPYNGGTTTYVAATKVWHDIWDNIGSNDTRLGFSGNNANGDPYWTTPSYGPDPAGPLKPQARSGGTTGFMGWVVNTQVSVWPQTSYGTGPTWYPVHLVGTRYVRDLNPAGEPYFDLVGLDGYNTPPGTWSAKKTFYNMFNQPQRFATEIGADFCIGECACLENLNDINHGGTDPFTKGVWFRDALSVIKGLPAVPNAPSRPTGPPWLNFAWISWTDYNANPGYVFDSTPDSFAAILAVSQDPIWEGAISPPPPPPPFISSFLPISGPVGTSVVINGSSLTGATVVKFGGVPALSFTVNSDSRITALVPTGAVTGHISVTTPNGTASSTAAFTVTTITPPSPPTITSFSPSSGLEGSFVIILGTHFNGVTSVTFGGVPSLSVSGTDTQLTVQVPVGAVSGPIRVTTPAGLATSGSSFLVDVPPPPPPPPTLTLTGGFAMTGFGFFMFGGMLGGGIVTPPADGDVRDTTFITCYYVPSFPILSFYGLPEMEVIYEDLSITTPYEPKFEETCIYEPINLTIVYDPEFDESGTV